MIDYDKIRVAICKGLKNYVGCPVVRANQDQDPPAYPYISYTITTLMSENKGTYGEYEDGTLRKPVGQTWSITALSDDNGESVRNAIKAREWLDRVGTVYLSENDVIVESVGGVTNRDNYLTTGYEYRNGFDCFLSLFDTIGETTEEDGYIEEIDISNTETS